MQRRRLVQPYMAVDTGTFVKPALLERGVGTDADKILFSVIQVFRNVVYLRGIAARFVSQVETVYPDTGITEDTVELKIKMFAEVLLWHGDGLSGTIPQSFRGIYSRRLYSHDCGSPLWHKANQPPSHAED